YAQLRAGTNPTLSATTLLNRAQDVVSREMALQPSMRSGNVLRVARDLQDLVVRYGGNVPLDQLYAHQQRVGLLIRQATTENWPNISGLRQMYSGIHADIDRAVASGIPEAATLRQATQAARREFVQRDLETMFAPDRGLVRRSDGLVQVKGRQLLGDFERTLRTDDVFRNSFTPAEQTEIRELLLGMSRLPVVPPARGIMRGSGVIAGRSVAAGGITYLVTPQSVFSEQGGLAPRAAPARTF